MGSFCVKGVLVPDLPPQPHEDEENKEDILARQRRAEKRSAAIKELIETEQTYVDGLKLCIHAYYNGLSQDKKIINREDLKIIFNDIEIIYKLNQTFLDDLHNDTTMIGDRFIEFTPYFKMYQNYCNNYDQVTVLMSKYCENEPFNSVLLGIRDKCEGKTLNGLLILPIQRLPRYRLCLTEIIKNTESYHPDLDNLNNALQLVAQTTTQINQRMKEFEQRQKVRSIEALFKNDKKIDLVKPHRKFIRDGIMTKVDKTGKDKVYRFFLFNDMICYASNKGKQEEKSALKMHTLLPVDRSFYIQDIGNHAKYKNLSFEIHSSIKSFIVHCDEYRDKEKWMRDIKETIEESMQLQFKGSRRETELAAPLMVPDDWSNICQIDGCGAKFSFVNRKHHCRYCGKLVCGKCGKYKLASKVNKDKVVRVCKPCYSEFYNIYPANGKEEELFTDVSNDSNDSDV